MNIIAIIQARMGSKRYPKKMLSTFLGKPLLYSVVKQIMKTNFKPKIILATTDSNIDTPLANYGKKIGLKVMRGPNEDVMERFALTLKNYKCDAFFRVCGDSPLLLPFLFDEAVNIFKDKKYDIITNVYPRKFPEGMSVELIKSKLFLKVQETIIDKVDREHITRHFYCHPNNYKIYNIEPEIINFPNLSLAVDNFEDMKRIEEWYFTNSLNYEKLFPIKSPILNI